MKLERFKDNHSLLELLICSFFILLPSLTFAESQNTASLDTTTKSQITEEIGAIEQGGGLICIAQLSDSARLFCEATLDLQRPSQAPDELLNFEEYCQRANYYCNLYSCMGFTLNRWCGVRDTFYLEHGSDWCKLVSMYCTAPPVA